ncbi:MAG: hypothetical protein A2294_01505 [Candidatus Magasanikbacteria bacterium RIFOXYB2_FULL_38_10]|nr:MAG: hypothetical protein A2294_01505 [Candidatus Magasanikbacteria bacterium RIFOXYB2_FULL_38_10]
MSHCKLKISFFLFFLLFSCGFFGLNSPVEAAVKQPAKKVSVKFNPAKISTYFLANEEGKCLKSKESVKAVPIASLTKLMTALVFMENRVKEWDETIVYNPNDHYVYANYLKFKKGDVVKVKDLLYGMLVASVNEPPRMLVDATNLSLKDFVVKMNAKAQRLGMENTIYVDPSGISPKNVSTSADQAKILAEVYQYSELREVLDTTTYNFDVIGKTGKVVHHHIKHTNSLIGKTDFSILSSKTGYLDEAKNCLAMVIQKNGRIYYVVTLGDPSRYRDFGNTEYLVQKSIF